MHRSTQNCAAEVAVGVEERSPETIHPGASPATLGNELQLVLVVSNDFSQFLLDIFGFARLGSESSQSLGRLVDLAPLDEEARGFWEEHEATTENQGPQHLNSNGNTVRAGVLAILGCVRDTGSKKETDRNAKLIARDDSTTDSLGRDLGHVQNDDGGHESNAEASDQSTGDHQTETRAGGGSFENGTNQEDNAADDDGNSAAEEIGKITSNDGAEEGTSRKDRNDQGLLPGGNGKSFFGGIVGTRRRCCLACVLVDDKAHAEYAVDPTRVVAKEDTTERREGAHEVRLRVDRGFDTRSIGGRDDPRSTRHLEVGCRINFRF